MPRDAPLLDLHPRTLGVDDATTIDASDEVPASVPAVAHPLGRGGATRASIPLMIHGPSIAGI